MGQIIFAFQLFWPPSVISYFKDPLGHRLGNKTTTLEFLGILLPFILIPEQLLNQVIEVKVDNMACYFGWLNRHVKGDVTASILIRSLHLISSFLGCQVHITHLPWKSSWDAIVVDRLSRSSSTNSQDKRLLASFPDLDMPSCIKEWLTKPVEDWELADKLLDSVVKTVSLVRFIRLPVRDRFCGILKDNIIITCIIQLFLSKMGCLRLGIKYSKW